MLETMYDLEFEDANRTTWFLVRQVNHFMNRALWHSLRKHRVTPEHLIVLWICHDYPGQKISAEIARLMSITENTVTGLLNRMETDGLVLRVPRRKGQPFTEIKLTAKGKEVYNRGVPILKAAFKGAPDWLTGSQMRSLNKLLRILRDGLAEDLYIEVEPVRGWG